MSSNLKNSFIVVTELGAYSGTMNDWSEWPDEFKFYSISQLGLIGKSACGDISA